MHVVWEIMSCLRTFLLLLSVTGFGVSSTLLVFQNFLRGIDEKTRAHGVTDSDDGVHRVARRSASADQTSICNANTSFECVCSGCFSSAVNDGNMVTSECCRNILPLVIKERAVSLSFANYSDSHLTAKFETNLKTALSNVIITYCATDPALLCDVTNLPKSRLTSSVVVVDSNQTPGIATLQVAIAAMLKYIAVDENAVLRKRRATKLTRNNSVPFVEFVPRIDDKVFTRLRKRRFVATPSIPDDDVVKTETLIKIINSQRMALTNALGVAIADGARPFRFASESKTPIGPKALTSIIVGSIFGVIFVIICLISAHKAFRDRAKMKARIENRRLTKQTVPSRQKEEAYQLNGAPLATRKANGINKETALDEADNDQAHARGHHLAYSNTVTVHAEIYQPTNSGLLQNGRSANTKVGVPELGGHHTDRETAGNIKHQNISQDRLPNGQTNGLPSKLCSDDEQMATSDDVMPECIVYEDESSNMAGGEENLAALPPSYDQSVPNASQRLDDILEGKRQSLPVDDRGVDNVCFDDKLSE